MTTYKVGYFVGSLSSTSINRILSKALIRVAPEDLEFSEIPIGNLPLYSPDFDNDYPPEAQALKASIRHGPYRPATPTRALWQRGRQLGTTTRRSSSLPGTRRCPRPDRTDGSCLRSPPRGG